MSLTRAQREHIRRERSRLLAERIRYQTEGLATRTVVITVPLICALAELSEDEREAWVDRNLVGRSLATTARDMGLSRERARQLEWSAAKKLSLAFREAA